MRAQPRSIHPAASARPLLTLSYASLRTRCCACGWCFSCWVPGSTAGVLPLFPAACCCAAAPGQAACAIPALMGLEMPLVRVLAAMEAAGMPADPAALHSTAPAMEARLAQLEAAAAAYNAGGAAFSLTSAKKVRQLLFDKLKLVSPARNSHTR